MQYTTPEPDGSWIIWLGYQDFKEQIEEFCCKITKKARNIQILVKNILLFQ